MTYLAVPEYHKKGALHFHLLVGNINEVDLKLQFAKRIFVWVLKLMFST